MKTKIFYLKQFKPYFEKKLWKAIQVIHITYITDILKFISEACKNDFFIKYFYVYKTWLITIKFFFIISLYTYIKMVNKYYQKTKKSFEKKRVKGNKIFLKEKKKKS